MIVSSANGTFADEVERKVFSEFYPSVPVYAPKPALGEALGCERFAPGCGGRLGASSPAVARNSGGRLQTPQRQPGNPSLSGFPGVGNLRRV